MIGQSQQTIADSLEQLLISSNSDYDKIDLNLGLARYHMLTSGQGELSKEYALEALELARVANSKKYQALAFGFVAQIDGVLAIPSDSLYVIAYNLAKESKDIDAELFTSYLLVERIYSSSEQDSAIVLLEGVLSKVEENTSLKHVGNTLKVLAYAYERLGQLDQAESIYLKAIDVFKQNAATPSINPDIGRVSAMEYDGGAGNVAQCHSYVALVYVLKGEYDNARQHIETSITVAGEGGPSNLAGALSNAGSSYRDMGDYSEAIAAYREAIDLLQSINEPLWLGDMYISLGQIYTDMGEYPEGENSFLKAYDLIVQLPSVAADLYLDMGELYSKWNKPEKAIQAYIKADAIYQELGEPLEHLKCQLSLAELQIINGSREIPSIEVERLLPEIEATNDIALLHQAYLTLSKIEISKSNPQQAIVYGEKSLDIAQSRNNDLQMSQQSHQYLAGLYEGFEDFENGLLHHKKYKETSDSLITDLALQKLKEQQVSQNVKGYIAEKEDAERLSQALAQQKNLYLIVSALLGLLLAGGTYLFYQLGQTRIKIENQNTELNELNATKDRFFGIIAHDIRSPIAALQSVDAQMTYYAKKGNTEKLTSLSGMVGSTAQRLNALLDNLLNWALLQTKSIPYHPKVVSIRGVAEEAIQLFTTNAESKGVFIENRIEGRTAVYVDQQALETIIRNLLSNAIKYCKEGETVRLSSVMKGSTISIIVKDNGAGMSQDQLDAIYQVGKKSQTGTAGESGTGLGLVLIKELVDLNKGEMAVASSIGEGTEVTIVLPLAKTEKI